MAALNFFKKEVKPVEQKTPPPPAGGLGEKQEKLPPANKKLLTPYANLQKVHVTEKATMVAEQNHYTFVVSARATKIEIKKAVKQTYGVDAQRVHVIHMPSKKTRLGKTKGVKPGFKKAVVKLKKGQSIEILPK